jgi:tRNA threonylcarbamoyladenosine biosynthesis protein TsaE
MVSTASRVATTTLRELITNSPAETEAEGERLGSQLKPGDLLLLAGPLGAGKTTFVRGLARGAGSDAHVASPTFQLVRVYPGRVLLAHVDLYRVKVASELLDLGLDELLDEGAVVVEWGDRLVAKHGRLITFEPLEGDRRRLVLADEAS